MLGRDRIFDFPTPTHWKIKILIHIRRQTRQRAASSVLDLHFRVYLDQTKTRLSAAMNLAMQGVPLDFIAKLGGWKNLDILQRYLLATGLDVARMSMGYRFFEWGDCV